ncbi:MAG: transglycosylase SLT domain-containing protein [Betaproteobacteria bacterium]
MTLNLIALVVAAAAAFTSLQATAQAPAAPAVPAADAPIVEARDALRKNDRARLAALKASTAAARHPLASWVDYWELSARLNTASVAEVDGFFSRWSGTYVEDRLRNDWLLELGRRRDWAPFAREFPRFRMNDDREVTCYALLTQHQAGADVRRPAREAWYAQRDADEGCQLLARTLFEDRQFTAAEVWQEVRLSAENNRPRAARAAAALLGDEPAQAVGQIFDNPARWLAQRKPTAQPEDRQLRTVAVIRLAASDPEAAVGQLTQPWAADLPAPLKAAAWGVVAKQAALKLQPEAAGWYRRAFDQQRASQEPAPWSDDTLAWGVRAALRSTAPEAQRWALVLEAVGAMSAQEQKDAAWVYWRARALQAQAPRDAAGDEARAGARQLMQSIASPLSFYGKLASEDLGLRPSLPSSPAPSSPAEREAAAGVPGLQRGLHMISLGLRSEGVREWNFTLRGMTDRELLAAAQVACEREVWDRCINTSDRTKAEINLAQRFPTPFRQDVVAAARRIGLDPAYVYGLIRQESRFIMDARSHVGASGLMQLMPATARWTARKIGLDFKPEMINDREVNLRLGTAYLKLVLDDFGGSAAMAAAAYNAGPSRPRRWREGPPMEVAAWAENIPFTETRDYVKKVLSNATVYAALLEGAPTLALKVRLGAPIGPRDGNAPSPDKDLP